MAEVVLRDLVNLERLTYYDTKIKQWVVNMISTRGGDSNVIFIKQSDLPQQGEKNILYITEDSILQWDGISYNEISSSGSSGSLGTWGSF